MRRAVLVTGLVCLTPVVSHSIGRSLYSLLLVAIETDLGLSHAQAGVPGSAIFVFYVVGVLLVVFWAPRFEPITIMRVGLFAAAVGTVIAATAGNLVTLTLGVGLVGGAGAGIWMSAPVLATAYVSERRRGLVIGLLTASIGLANVAAGGLTTALRRSQDDDTLWRPVWWIAGAFVAVLLLVLVAVARFPASERVRTRGLDLSIIRQIPQWKRLTAAYTLFGGMAAGFGSFILAALEEHGGLSSEQAALMFSIMGIAGMLAAPAAGAASDRFGRYTVMRIALGLATVAAVAVMIGGPGPTRVGAVVASAGSAAFPTLVAAVVRDSLDQRSFSQALAMMTVLFSVFAATVPIAVGWLADATDGFAWPYALLATFPLAALITLASPAPRETAQSALL